ncbi:MAG: SEC-C metal-binding domain-containing protein [Coriobacteriia bacterium]|nr:SEC-C metal-binding domain-containing protein [Coriobacteriia bacterium]
MTNNSAQVARFNAMPIADKLLELALGSVRLFGFVNLADFVRTAKELYSVVFNLEDAIAFFLSVCDDNDDFCLHEYDGDLFLISKQLVETDYDLHYEENEDGDEEGGEESDGAFARFVELYYTTSEYPRYLPTLGELLAWSNLDECDDYPQNEATRALLKHLVEDNGASENTANVALIDLEQSIRYGYLFEFLTAPFFHRGITFEVKVGDPTLDFITHVYNTTRSWLLAGHTAEEVDEQVDSPVLVSCYEAAQESDGLQEPRMQLEKSWYRNMLQARSLPQDERTSFLNRSKAYRGKPAHSLSGMLDSMSTTQLGDVATSLYRTKHMNTPLDDIITGRVDVPRYPQSYSDYYDMALAMLVDSSLVESLLIQLPEHEFETTMAVCECDEVRKDINDQNVPILSRESGLIGIYAEKDELVFVMPDEVKAVIAALEPERLRANHAQAHAEWMSYLDNLAFEDEPYDYDDFEHESDQAHFDLELPAWAVDSVLSGAEAYGKPTQTRKHVGRNDPCPCGSDKKYKRCCGSVSS